MLVAAVRLAPPAYRLPGGPLGNDTLPPHIRRLLLHRIHADRVANQHGSGKAWLVERTPIIHFASIWVQNVPKALENVCGNDWSMLNKH